jgi:hypothetical protein
MKMKVHFNDGTYVVEDVPTLPTSFAYNFSGRGEVVRSIEFFEQVTEAESLSRKFE